MEEKVTELEAQYPDAVPRPSCWGGFRIKPSSIEFWQGCRDRLHDRIKFKADAAAQSWQIERLSP